MMYVFHDIESMYNFATLLGINFITFRTTTKCDG